MNPSQQFRRTAMLFFAGAVLQAIVIVFSGFALFADMAPGVALWTAFALGLLRGMRWLAYIAFFACLVALVFALGHAMSTSGLTSLALWALLAVNFLAALGLFAILWRPKSAPAA